MSQTDRQPSSLRRDNIFAPASLICGILAWTLLPLLAAPAAMLAGHIAYAKSKRLGVGGRGMALAGMALGYSGLAAAAMLIGVLLALPEGKSLFPQEAAEQPAQAAAPQPKPRAAKPAKPVAVEEKPLPPVIPPQAEVILAAQHAVAERLAAGESLDEINEGFPLDEEDRRYWQNIEARQGTVIITPKPDARGFARQIMLLSAQDNGRLTWTCIGELEKSVEPTVCR